MLCICGSYFHIFTLFVGCLFGVIGYPLIPGDTPQSSDSYIP